MFITPYFGGCKYTNNILIINKIAVFQRFDLLITYQRRTNKDNAMTFRGRAVTASKALLAQLITKVAFVAAFKGSRVSIPAKTATAQQIMQTRLQKTLSFTYLCKEIHALRERCGAWMERKNV